MAVEVKYGSSATAIFLNLQSGLARPYWEINITVSGDSSTFSGTLGQAYSINDIISVGNIDREKPSTISGLSKIFAGNVNITLNNACGTYSPINPNSIFVDVGGTAMDWVHSTINIWAGFENTSGTAYTIQRGSFLLTQLRIDGHDRKAYLGCEDVAKLPLQEYIGLADISGTANTWTPPSGINTKAIMIDILSGVELTASQYDIASGIDFTDYSKDDKKINEALAELAQASDGFLFTNGKGQIVFRLNVPQFAGLGGGVATDLTIKDTDRITKSRYTIDVKNLINKVQVNFSSGLESSQGDEDTSITKGRPHTIDNETIDRSVIAGSISSKILGEYGENRAYMEIDNIFLPSLEIGDRVSVYDTNTYQTAISYEIYRIREDIVNLKTKIYGAVDLKVGKKWGFVSSSDTANCGTSFTDSWHSGFGFVSVSGTGFDDDGNNDNAITTGFAASGAGTTGIEMHFRVY